MIKRVWEVEFIERDVWKGRRIVDVDHGIDRFVIGGGDKVLLFDRACVVYEVVDGLFLSFVVFYEVV